MPTALLSVSDKTGLVDFAASLQSMGWSLLSTGGTARTLRENGIPVTEVSDATGHPEIMDGRVKTLHPAIHGGLLGRTDLPEHRDAMAEHGYEPIDLLVVNLYPFRETIARSGVTRDEAIEQIDIGGPAMLRSGAKNHDRVWVVVDPADYAAVLAALRSGDDGVQRRRELAAKVFAHTSKYDAAITAYLTGGGESGASGEGDQLPDHISLDLIKVQPLRYGENPDQRAALYRDGSEKTGVVGLRQLQGKELSFNNLIDVDGAVLAVATVSGLGRSACAIVKHTTPCGLAVAADSAEAYRAALATDPTSAFGSVIALSTAVTAECAELMKPNFVEAIIAPSFEAGALETLASKKNLRLLEWTPGGTGGLDFKRIRGGFLVQDRISMDFREDHWKVASAREPSEEEWEDLRFAWRAVTAVKSNAILLARGGATLGIGAGQMSRVDASRIAVMKANDQGHAIRGSVLASDAFFPFRDGVDAAASDGVTAIVQPGGSVRDEEVIAAANEHGIAMVMTGRRLFRH